MNPPLSGWRGGKSRLLKTLLPLVPGHVCYCEPFAGAAWLLFNREPSPVEVLNDLNGDIANVYKILRDNPEGLARLFAWPVRSRQIFNEARDSDPSDPLLRAWRFLYLLKVSFSGNMRAFGTYAGSGTDRDRRYPLGLFTRTISAFHDRLRKCLVENLPYWDCIARYDRPTTFFYIDPPYYGFERIYGKSLFARQDFGLLAGLLANLRGKFLMSINDVPEVRVLFKDFSLRPVTVTYTINSGVAGRAKKAPELLVANYEINSPLTQDAEKEAPGDSQVNTRDFTIDTEKAPHAKDRVTDDNA